MKTLTTKPYNLFDLMKSNIMDSSLDSSIPDIFFGSNLNLKNTSCNIKDLEDHICLEMIVPGFKKNEIEISFENNLITVKGKKVSEKETDKSNYILNEYKLADFTRSFKVNPNLNTEEIYSTLEDGILNVKIPKVKKAESKKIIKIN